MTIYQDHEAFATGENAVTVAHACGHEVRYEYGGTAEYFALPRARFAQAAKNEPCPECRLLGQRRNDGDIPIPGGAIRVLAAPGGQGTLIMRDSKVLLVLDKPLIVEAHEEISDPDAIDALGGRRFQWYTYRANVLGNEVSYLHHCDGCEYTEEQLAWIDEYTVRGLADREPGWFEGRYGIGRTLRRPGQHEEAERRCGRPIPITVPCDEHERPILGAGSDSTDWRAPTTESEEVMEPTEYHVGKPFPGAYPTIEGAVMEMQGDGPVVLIQMPGCRREEVRAFKAGFKRYSYLESDTPVPVALWAFDFPRPHGPIDVNFNARVANREFIDAFLDASEGVHNRVLFFLLDGPILRAIKLSGLDSEAVLLFQATIRKQLAAEFSPEEYRKYLDGLLRFTTAELFDLGKQFKHRGPKHG
jgi:hypothetical protein